MTFGPLLEGLGLVAYPPTYICIDCPPFGTAPPAGVQAGLSKDLGTMVSEYIQQPDMSTYLGR